MNTLIRRTILLVVLVVEFSFLLVYVHNSFEARLNHYRTLFQLRTVALNQQSDQSRKKWECLNRNRVPNIKSHWDAPLHSFPKNEDLVSPVSANLHACDQGNQGDNLRVVLILNRLKRRDMRDMIRRTWANFTIYSTSGLRGNWTKLFLVGRPEDDGERDAIAKEIDEFGDIIVANTFEGWAVCLYL